MKRRREEDDATVGAMDVLEQCAGHDSRPDTKLTALRGVLELIDPTDTSYEAQRRIAASDTTLDALLQMLDDESEAVVVAAAAAVAAVADHAGVVRDRLEAGHFVATPERVPLNPVQGDMGAVDGLISALVDKVFSGSADVSAAGSDTLSALTSFNRANTLALIHEAVTRLSSGEGRALGLLDDIVAGVDVRDDIAVCADQALRPALGFLASGSPAERTAAARLLGTLATGRRGPAAYLLAEGALPHAAALLATGDLEARDTAAALVWELVKGDRRLLAPGRGTLGLEGALLVAPLLDLVDRGEGEASKGEGASSDAGATAVDNSDEALLLLRALSAQDPAVAAAIRGAASAKGAGAAVPAAQKVQAKQSGCAIM